jgi:hypothetical protein
MYDYQVARDKRWKLFVCRAVIGKLCLSHSKAKCVAKVLLISLYLSRYFRLLNIITAYAMCICVYV